ncbi:MAG: 50S ribosomal protein L22 [Bacteroidales bacterium]|jgi:large subunit ribosomal protein L22|nr:50S ribosomal protein L22 [Bacteroidales bacterium]
MGSRKHIVAEARKKAKKNLYMAKLVNNPSSPRKARLIADAIRGVDVDKALGILQYSQKESALKFRKLLLSAIANWQSKNEGKRIEESNLYVKSILVDGGRQVKRLRTAPQGRGYRIKKRSNHVTIVLEGREDTKTQVAQGLKTEESK